ncbi:MAG: hypothetical protein Q4A21_01795 [bacterium]|nr:hypothetical protein [bacterium]
MICIAAFVIFLIIWLFTPFLRLVGQKKLADSISKLFKKSLHCFTRRATFKACDSNFGDEIKNSILSKIIVKHKNWVKPVSVAIEGASLVIIIVSVWSLLTLVKSGLALWTFGTCDVRKPDACALSSAEACSIDDVSGGNPVSNWFEEWGEIFNAIPTKFMTFKAKDFMVENSHFYGQFSEKSENSNGAAVDFFDPGCIVCRNSFASQKSSGFFEKYKTHLVPYVIRGGNGDKFANSDLLARYIEAVRDFQPENGPKLAAEWFLVEKIFTGKDAQGVVWQENFNGKTLKAMTSDKVEEKLSDWLGEAGFSSGQIEDISKSAKSEKTTSKLERNRQIVEEKVKTKRIPTSIYDGKRHEGLYKPQN